MPSSCSFSVVVFESRARSSSLLSSSFWDADDEDGEEELDGGVRVSGTHVRQTTFLPAGSAVEKDEAGKGEDEEDDGEDGGEEEEDVDDDGADEDKDEAAADEGDGEVDADGDEDDEEDGEEEDGEEAEDGDAKADREK